jgi:hypothetical protein
VLLIALSFRAVGRLWRRCARGDQRAMAWALGVSLFAHVVSFIGVSYFGQIQVVWFMLLAAITSLAAVGVCRPAAAPAPGPHAPPRLELGAA